MQCQHCPVILSLALTASALPNAIRILPTSTSTTLTTTTTPLSTYTSTSTKSSLPTTTLDFHSIVFSDEHWPLNATRSMNDLHIHPDYNVSIISLGLFNATDYDETNTPPPYPSLQYRSLLRSRQNDVQVPPKLPQAIWDCQRWCMPRPTGAEGGIGRDIYGPDGTSGSGKVKVPILGLLGVVGVMMMLFGNTFAYDYPTMTTSTITPTAASDSTSYFIQPVSIDPNYEYKTGTHGSNIYVNSNLKMTTSTVAPSVAGQNTTLFIQPASRDPKLEYTTVTDGNEIYVYDKPTTTRTLNTIPYPTSKSDGWCVPQTTGPVQSGTHEYLGLPFCKIAGGTKKANIPFLGLAGIVGVIAMMFGGALGEVVIDYGFGRLAELETMKERAEY